MQVVPTDRQLWAIGMVAVQWSGLELSVRMFVYGLTATDQPARGRFDATQNTKRRLDQFYALVDERMMEPPRTNLLALIDRIRGVQAERDKIIHGAWESNPVNYQDPDWARSFGLANPKPPYEWKLTFAKINDVARKIDGLNYELMAGILSLGGAEGLTLSSALQSTLHKQYRPA